MRDAAAVFALQPVVINTPMPVGFVLCRTTQPSEINPLGVKRAENSLRVCVLASASSLVDVAQCGMGPDGLL